MKKMPPPKKKKKNSNSGNVQKDKSCVWGSICSLSEVVCFVVGRMQGARESASDLPYLGVKPEQTKFTKTKTKLWLFMYLLFFTLWFN